MALTYGGNTFSYMWKADVASAIGELRNLGLNDFDIIMSPGHLWPDDLSSQDRAALARRLRDDDIRIESLNPPALDYNLGSAVPEVRRQAIDMYTKTIELSAELGGRGTVVVPGRVSALFPPAPKDTEGWLKDSIGELIRVADRSGQRIYVEGHPLTSIPRAEDLIAFVDHFNVPNLSIAYDVANGEFIGESQAEAIKLMGNRLGQLHFSDGTRTQWRHDAVGNGTVDFQSAIAAAEEIGFDGIVVLEIISQDPVRDISRSIAALAGR